jgi:hypothetical protein
LPWHFAWRDARDFCLQPFGGAALSVHGVERNYDGSWTLPRGEEGGNVNPAPCDGNTAQKWMLDGRALRSLAGECLDVVNGLATPGATVHAAACNGTQAQQWFAADHYSEGIATLLIITDEKMKAAAEPLVAHKNATGMPAALTTIDELTQQFLHCGADCPDGTVPTSQAL